MIGNGCRSPLALLLASVSLFVCVDCRSYLSVRPGVGVNILKISLRCRLKSARSSHGSFPLKREFFLPSL